MPRPPRREPPGSVRIIGGRWRGRKLVVPPQTAARPTPNRARETLFNWLAPVIEGARCIDLYAGTGALGFEALSRGARRVDFIERDHALAAALREGALELGAEPSAFSVAEVAAERYLAGESQPRYDVAFLDPPYAVAIGPLLASLERWLVPGGLVYVERGAREGDLAATLADAGEIVKQSRAAGVAYGLVRLAPA